VSVDTRETSNGEEGNEAVKSKKEATEKRNKRRKQKEATWEREKQDERHESRNCFFKKDHVPHKRTTDINKSKNGWPNEERVLASEPCVHKRRERVWNAVGTSGRKAKSEYEK
jgi:hypothetical protein